MIDGFVKWNGGATLQLDAPDSGKFAGLLIYLPPTHPNVVNGNGDSHVVGSILAPASEVTVEGGGGLLALSARSLAFMSIYPAHPTQSLISRLI